MGECRLAVLMVTNACSPKTRSDISEDGALERWKFFAAHLQEPLALGDVAGVGRREARLVQRRQPLAQPVPCQRIDPRRRQVLYRQVLRSRSLFAATWGPHTHGHWGRWHTSHKQSPAPSCPSNNGPPCGRYDCSAQRRNNCNTRVVCREGKVMHWSPGICKTASSGCATLQRQARSIIWDVKQAHPILESFVPMPLAHLGDAGVPRRLQPRQQRRRRHGGGHRVVQHPATGTR